jgi:hypothetical protein
MLEGRHAHQGVAIYFSHCRVNLCQIGRLRYAENPTLNLCHSAFARQKLWTKKPGEAPVTISAAQPSRNRICVVLIATTLLTGKAPAP